MNRLELDICLLARGIDNVRVDVQLSAGFNELLQRLVGELLRKEVAARPPSTAEQEKLLVRFRDSYRDMMTVLLHRLKTGLEPSAVELLQFAVLKQVLQTSRARLDEYLLSRKVRSSELRTRGSAEALDIHTQIVWLGKHYNRILVEINQQLLTQLLRAEERHLEALRERYLPPDRLNFREFLENPLLAAVDPSSPYFLIRHYRYWGRSRRENENTAFNFVNHALEALIGKHFPEEEVLPLHAGRHDPALATETRDELGGLLASQFFMGVALDNGSVVREEFSWLDDPGNVKVVFDLEAGQVGVEAAPQDKQRERKRIRKILQEFAHTLKASDLLQTLVASSHVQQLRGREIGHGLDPYLLCQFLGGQIDLKQLQDSVSANQGLGADELALLAKTLKEVKKDTRRNGLQHCHEIMQAVVSFRRHMRHYRFAHRLFNRMQLLERPEDIRLSRQAGTLYQLPMANEVDEEDARIVHHAVLKADIRDSTGLTARLVEQGLNPASHFSMRFFDPINSVAEAYGGIKVFIEGDAVIFSFLEYDHSPQQWFSVARACGMARAMLDIIRASNRYSQQANLPLLETGIGICYRSDAPQYLFDGDRPIMISSAVAGADRRSSCAWQLRECMQGWPFQVEAVEMSEGDGRPVRQLYYNVNGVCLEPEAFSKLESEISLQSFTASVGGASHHFYRGEYPDTSGRRKNLLIREGRTGSWLDGTYTAGTQTSSPYYEVVADPGLLKQIGGEDIEA